MPFALQTLLGSLLGSSAVCHPAESPTAFSSQCRITQVVAAALQTVLGVILGGGAGSRLYPLTKKRAKPAVPLGANYRLIDIPVSNCINSNVNKIYCLTQFNSASLNRHLSQAYVSASAPGSATHRVPRQEGRLRAAALYILLIVPLCSFNLLNRLACLASAFGLDAADRASSAALRAAWALLGRRCTGLRTKRCVPVLLGLLPAHVHAHAA